MNKLRGFIEIEKMKKKSGSSSRTSTKNIKNLWEKRIELAEWHRFYYYYTILLFIHTYWTTMNSFGVAACFVTTLLITDYRGQLKLIAIWMIKISIARHNDQYSGRRELFYLQLYCSQKHTRA